MKNIEKRRRKRRKRRIRIRLLPLLILSALIIIFTDKNAIQVAGKGTVQAISKKIVQVTGKNNNQPESSDLLLLVNKEHPVPEDYENSDMTEITEVPITKSTIFLNSKASDALAKMYEYLRAEGLYLNVVSGYRNYNYQKTLFNKEVNKQSLNYYNYETAYKTASRIVAIPGTSEHQLGLAVDVSTNSWLSESFENTKTGTWLKENCYKYGFILRYDYDKQDITNIIYEPWHFRYVGEAHAKFMYDNHLAFEEYIAYLQETKTLQIEFDENTIYYVYYLEENTSFASDDYNDIVDISSDNCGGIIITALSQ